MKEERLRQLPTGIDNMVLRLCIDCDTEFEINRRIPPSKSPRCKTCQERRNKVTYDEWYAKQRQAKEENLGSQRAHTGKDAPWKMIFDSDNSWGYNTRFGIEEIRLLMANRYKYLAPGTKFRNVHSGELLEIQY